MELIKDNYISKEEFQQILEDPKYNVLIGSYDTNDDGSLLDIYYFEGWDLDASLGQYSSYDQTKDGYNPDAIAWLDRYHKYSTIVCDDFDSFGTFTLVRLDELGDIYDEAFDRVWYDRSDSPQVYLNSDLSDEHKQSIVKAITTVKEKYHIDDEQCDDFYHGYWSGILALCRYLLDTSENTADIEDLRSGNGLLST